MMDARAKIVLRKIRAGEEIPSSFWIAAMIWAKDVLRADFRATELDDLPLPDLLELALSK